MYSAVASAIYRAGALLRNPSVMGEYQRVKASEWSSRAQLLGLQLERAVKFLEFAERYSPFYRRLFEECGFTPRKMSSIADLQALPTIDKSKLIAANLEIHTQYPFKKVFLAETSGTTGSALEFKKNERWDSINRAYQMRGYDWYGVKPWHRNGYLWGYDLAPEQARRIRVLDSLQNRFRLFAYDRESVRRFASALRGAHFLGGYSSMIFEVAKIINELGMERPRLRMVKGTSEMILPVYQPEAERAFGRRIISEYGAAESGLIAFECPSGKMHVNMEDVVVEVDDDGGIIVTNLASYSFPIIRYALGDTVTLCDEECDCGRAHPVISEVLGRKGAAVVGASGRYPALSFYYVFKNLALQESVLLNYKALQREPGAVDIYIEGVAEPKHERLIRAELSKYFRDDVEFSIEFLPAFDRSRKKAQYFESRL